MVQSGGVYGSGEWVWDGFAELDRGAGGGERELFLEPDVWVWGDAVAGDAAYGEQCVQYGAVFGDQYFVDLGDVWAGDERGSAAVGAGDGAVSVLSGLAKGERLAMNSSTRLAPISKVIVLVNSLLIALLLFSSSSEYFNHKHMSEFTGDHFDARVFVARNLSQLVGLCGFALLLFAGAGIELLRSRFAWLVNVGAPLFALILLLGQMLQHRNPDFSGEAEQLIIIAVMPLVAMMILYSTIYYRQSKVNAGTFALAN